MRNSLLLLCTAGLVSGLSLMPAARAQRIVDVTPSVNAQAASADALVSGLFDSSGGSVDVSTVRILLDGQDVTANSSITQNFFSYRPAQPLSPGQHRVQVEYSNIQGQRRVASWSFATAAPQPELAINSVTHNAVEPLADEATLLATINGTPGAQASVLLIEDGSMVREIQAQEVSPGVYVASYGSLSGNRESIAVGQLRRGEQTIYAAAAQPVVVSTSAVSTDATAAEPDQAAADTPVETAVSSLKPEFTSHSSGEQIASRGFTLTGRTRPSATVEIEVNASTPLVGGFLNVGATQLVDETVIADMNGEFSIRVPAPLVVSSGTQYEVEAVARLDNEVSAVTQLMLEQQ
ncbi:MAG: hypothetical protein F6J97_13695 [Leptolyngbya sp. SIO4C1]|nr:hypothetical protein [Leptolyngbya sp. SIO4C1]